MGPNIMAWYGADIQNQGKMDQYVYWNILENVMEPYANKSLPLTWTLMHANDPKHTAKTVKQWLEEKQIRALEWSPQSPDLNPKGNLWENVEAIIKSNFSVILDGL